MGLLRVLVEILAVFKFLWTLFTVDSPKPILPVDQSFSTKPIPPVDLPPSTKPFRLLHLPSIAHDVILSHMKIAEIYHLSKCSRRSRYVVKMFTRCQKYNFTIHVHESFYCLGISSRCWRKSFLHELRPLNSREPLDEHLLVTNAKDYWATTKKEIAYYLDVFTDRVSNLHFRDDTKVIEMTEFLKSVLSSPVEWVSYVHEMPDVVYRYVLKEFESSTVGSIEALCFSNLRHNNLTPCHADFVWIRNTDWVTVDHLVRFFMNLSALELDLNAERSLITPALMPQFFNVWLSGSRIKTLGMLCNWTKPDLRVMFENVPTTEVERVEVLYEKKRFGAGECFLIRQEESGVEAIAYLTSGTDPLFIFTTSFRLLRDDESFDSDDSSDSSYDDEEDSESDDDL